ncbi:hypothetical protein [Duganella violaceipulchra]|uniref:Uncharacterized protein n=1 Tax=Duganella violaceipulchra TaxID=2849652 RepID=A0AA41H4X8_9BURK|nr:hypothetical protein [Duganella violaceicalia]MBV6319994.1 hypothetical protein [Duganella violaceicalia]MCP2010359.1 hypothetical protein [Duganella violaceicalia]
MKWIAFVKIALLIPATSFAGCEIYISDATVKAVNVDLRDRAKSISAIASGYRRSDPSEATWLMQLTTSIYEADIELSHLRDLIIIRNGVTGIENQRLVKKVFAIALLGASEKAQNIKDLLLGSTSISANPAVASEIARAVPVLEKVVHIGDSCSTP